MTKRDDIAGQALQAAQSLPPLLLAAEKVAHAVMSGGHGRKKSGHGDAFWQFRTYQPGDEPRHINWRKSAQTGALLVRETEWATAQSALLWRDSSPSMSFSSKPRLPTKRQRADLLLLATACLLERGGERPALMGASLPPSQGRDALAALAFSLERQNLDLAALPRLADIPGHAGILLFGDFLDPPETLKPVLATLSARGASGLIMQILDPAEIRFPYKGRILAEGCEGETPLLLSEARSLRKAYLDRLARHQEALHDMARLFGWHFRVHDTSASPRDALMDIHKTLAEGKAR